MVEQDEDKVAKARARVRRMRGFYSNLISYFLVNIVLIVINLVTSPNHLWFYWVTLIWGIILVVQAFNVFTLRDQFLGDTWEEKKIKELLEKEERKNREK
jgi:Na+/melibiose symporter-like transporter